MKRALACALLIVAGCKDDPVVLATLPPADALPDGAERCTRDECAAGLFCDRPGCDAPAGACHPFPTVCPPDESPVCGCDGVTYFNDCLRRAAGVAPAHPGECETNAMPCRGEAECPPGGSCSLLVGSDLRECGPAIVGRCWVLPVGCPPPGPDRWRICAPPLPEMPPPPCIDTCTAIRSGIPHHRELRCE